jgi:hypothetical protein
MNWKPDYLEGPRNNYEGLKLARKQNQELTEISNLTESFLAFILLNAPKVLVAPYKSWMRPLCWGLFGHHIGRG